MTMRRVMPRGPVSRANKVAAARVFIAASAKSGYPVPQWIRALADDASSTDLPGTAPAIRPADGCPTDER